MMRLIVAVDENWGIGRENQLLFHISADLKRFKSLTTGKVVVMGRKTLESMPRSAPLPNRTNVVLSTREPAEGVVPCRNLAELGAKIREFTEDIYIIGGETIYSTLLDYCAEALVTQVRAQKTADAYFPDLSRRANWQLAEESEIYHENGVEFSFCRYVNTRVKALEELK